MSSIQCTLKRITSNYAEYNQLQSQSQKIEVLNLLNIRLRNNTNSTLQKRNKLNSNESEYMLNMIKFIKNQNQ